LNCRRTAACCTWLTGRRSTQPGTNDEWREHTGYTGKKT